jgi:hypothetical protein
VYPLFPVSLDCPFLIFFPFAILYRLFTLNNTYWSSWWIL